MNSDEQKTALAEAQKEIKELKVQLSEANIKQYTDKITDLESKLAEATKLSADLAKANADKADEAKSALDKLTKDKEEAEAKVQEYKAQADEAIAKIDQLNKDKRTQDRVSAAIAKNAPQEEAKAFADKHADKSDEDFEEVLSYASYKWAATDKDTAKEEKKDKIDATAAKVLEGTTPVESEVVIAEGSVDNSLVEMQNVVRQLLKKEVK
jgi:chromosome segregation ATPase